MKEKKTYKYDELSEKIRDNLYDEFLETDPNGLIKDIVLDCLREHTYNETGKISTIPENFLDMSEVISN